MLMILPSFDPAVLTTVRGINTHFSDDADFVVSAVSTTQLTFELLVKMTLLSFNLALHC